MSNLSKKNVKIRLRDRYAAQVQYYKRTHTEESRWNSFTLPAVGTFGHICALLEIIQGKLEFQWKLTAGSNTSRIPLIITNSMTYDFFSAQYRLMCCYYRICTVFTLRFSAPQTALWGGPGPRFGSFNFSNIFFLTVWARRGCKSLLPE